MLVSDVLADVVAVAQARMTCCAALDDTASPYSRSCKRDASMYSSVNNDDDGGAHMTATTHAVAPPPPPSPPCVDNELLLTVLDDDDSRSRTVTVRATPYTNAVCGHHLMLAVGDTIWKSNLSAREVCFYDVLTRAAHGMWCDAHEHCDVCADDGNNNERDDKRGCTRATAVCQRAYASVASRLLPFLPRYHGTRRVCDMRAADVAATCVTDDRQTIHAHATTAAAARTTTTTSDLVRGVLEQFAHDLRAVQQQTCAHDTATGCDVNANDDDDMHACCDDDTDDDDAARLTWCVHTSPLARAIARRERARSSSCHHNHHDNSNSHDKAPLYVDMIVMEDVCYGFVRPCVLDIKMGSRQYGLHPTAAKKHSKEAKALRSTSAKYGIRLAGFRRWDDDAQCYERRGKAQLHTLSIDGVRETVRYFLSAADGGRRRGSSTTTTTATATAAASTSSRAGALRGKLLAQLRQLRDIVDTQSCLVVFTSSLLFVYDAVDPLRTGRVVMVDFAYAYDRAELQRAHDEAAADVHDEGYRHAVRSLIAVLE